MTSAAGSSATARTPPASTTRPARQKTASTPTSNATSTATSSPADTASKSSTGSAGSASTSWSRADADGWPSNSTETPTTAPTAGKPTGTGKPSSNGSAGPSTASAAAPTTVDPDTALTSLWDRLEALGIRPADAADTPPPQAAIVTGSVEETAAPADDIQASTSQRPDHPYVPRHSSGHLISPTPASGVTVPIVSEPPPQAHDSVSAVPEPPVEEAQIVGLAQPDAATSATPADRRLPVLAPHRAWQAHPVPDARSAYQRTIIDVIVDIVTGEGPVVTDRVYELYVRASGGQRVTKLVRDALYRATTVALRRGLLQQIKDDIISPTAKTLYLPGTPPVVPRRRGDRELEHIPPTEVAAVARHILHHDTGISDSELKRLLLIAFERVRMTTSASAFLDDCIVIARR